MSDHLIGEAAAFRSLQQVLEWAFAKQPPGELISVIAQDEFTHDVVVRMAPDVFLDFDTT
jgi:hypothetical protein